MNTQPTLFEEPARIEAYRVSQPKHGTAREQVLQVIQKRGMATINDVCKALNKQKNEVSGRLTELKRAGIIREVGKSTDKPRLTIYKVQENVC